MTTVNAWNGSAEIAGTVSLWNGTSEIAATADVFGAPSEETFNVGQMKASPGFVVAHRGGSGDWPEMSLHAYTQSVAHGAKALEVSLGRTSDGVWVGLHDDTMNRVAGVTGLPAIGQMTWAQVQLYRIKAEMAGQVSQPFMRWEELVAAYGRTRVFFVDPKSSFSPVPFFAAMALLPGDPTDKVVLKHYLMSGPIADHATSRGFECWGYAYEDDYTSGRLAANQSRWTMLGMAWDASTAAWTTAKSFGKPVLAHICPNSAATTTALAKGANGLMVSGITSVLG